jgi:RimJ/RimL family protein N-acetyltransferase
MVEPVALTTPRLLLRPFKPTDIDDLLAFAHDPEVGRFLPFSYPQPFLRRHAEELVARLVREPWEKHPYFAIVLNSHVIGRVDLTVDAIHNAALLGYALGREHWGKGYMQEAVKAVFDWAFQSLKLGKIWADVDAENVRSWRVMEKLGMKREALLRSHRVLRSERRDIYMYGILWEEWPPG